jgi:[acyl-carrier-protein] S-malonyltransferase
MLETLPGGFRSPSLPLLSGVTGRTSYNDYNSRELLHRWVDHPQRLWNMIYRTLVAGVETVVHVGPAPNLIPATFKRLSEDVRGQLAGRSPANLGLRAVSCMARRPWLAKLLPSCAALLRAPFIRHVILEDWLLERTTS